MNNIAANKGIKRGLRPLAIRLKISRSLMDHSVSKETRIKIAKAHLGIKHTKKQNENYRNKILEHYMTTAGQLHKKKSSDRWMGKGNPRWIGGKIINEVGYILIKNPHHPNSTKNGYVLEHRAMASMAIGRRLKKNEIIHHINGNPADNRNRNLLICKNPYHQWLHKKMATDNNLSIE